MRSSKSQKIDLNASYPCPCRRRGNIVPITLTEAFGCDRCQQIFVVRDSGYVIEQLSTHYPYKRAWRWTGHQWILAGSPLGKGYWPLMIFFSVFVFFALLFLITFQAQMGASLAVRLLAALMITLLLGFMFWLTCRR